MSGLLQALLGTFQKLVAGKLHDHEGFKLLEAIVEHVPGAALENYLPEVRSASWIANSLWGVEAQPNISKLHLCRKQLQAAFGGSAAIVVSCVFEGA